MDDALVVGAGPAGLAIAAALAQAGLRVAGLAPDPPDAPWPNTYGVWADQVEPLGLAHTLSHRWTDCAAYVDRREVALGRTYGLLDNRRLQEHLLTAGGGGAVRWHCGSATAAEHGPAGARVRTQGGAVHAARLVIDASGHRPVLLGRPAARMAYQAAYGIVARFSSPPVRSGQLVLMDYRADHLTAAQRAEPPTFLYAMDLGDGRFFVEETSLAHAPGVSLKLLEQRLHQRLAAAGARISEVQHVERCFFPMNPPLPRLDQPIVGFGAAASMIHPPSGYMVGMALGHAPRVAHAIAAALGRAEATPAQAAQAGWRSLWPVERRRRRALYLFGLASLMRCDQRQTEAFFRTFFELPFANWSRYLTDDLSTGELLAVMLQIFGRVPQRVRMTLAGSAGIERRLLWDALGMS
jgi:lycopene cyclase-like protein